MKANGESGEGKSLHARGTPLTVKESFILGESSADQWLLWQLADSAFPTGGFAHSAGLEGAWQSGAVRNRAELIAFVEATLRQTGHALLPFVSATHAEWRRLEELDALCEAFTSNHVANRASRAQGKAFLSAVQKIFAVRMNGASTPLTAPPFCHLAPVFGACLHLLGIEQTATSRLFLFNHLRSILAAAVRLNIVGPTEAQMLQQQMTATAELVLERCEGLTVEQIAQTSPLLEMWQGAQDRLYSRLFQS